MAFSRHTVGDQSPSERLCLYPDSGSLTRARNLVRGSHLAVLSPSRTSGAANSRDTIFPEICFLQFVAPVELRESVGSAARISYDRAPLVSAIGPLCISVMMLTAGWVLGFRGLPALYAMVMFA